MLVLNNMIVENEYEKIGDESNDIVCRYYVLVSNLKYEIVLLHFT